MKARIWELGVENCVGQKKMVKGGIPVMTFGNNIRLSRV